MPIILLALAALGLLAYEKLKGQIAPAAGMPAPPGDGSAPAQDGGGQGMPAVGPGGDAGGGMTDGGGAAAADGGGVVAYDGSGGGGGGDYGAGAAAAPPAGSYGAPVASPMPGTLTLAPGAAPARGFGGGAGSPVQGAPSGLTSRTVSPGEPGPPIVFRAVPRAAPTLQNRVAFQSEGGGSAPSPGPTGAGSRGPRFVKG